MVILSCSEIEFDLGGKYRVHNPPPHTPDIPNL